MSNWYKKAALGNDLTFVITAWLRNARNNPEIANAHDDISHQMQGADDMQNLSAAISSAVNVISREQGGVLTPSQQELVQHLQSRNQDQFNSLDLPSLEMNGNFSPPISDDQMLSSQPLESPNF